MRDQEYPHLSNNTFSLGTCFLCYLLGVATGIAVFIWLAQPTIDKLQPIEYTSLYE
jgi:hypothetical protein